MGHGFSQSGLTRWALLLVLAGACDGRRPAASGEVGVLRVYGQLEAPVVLPPGGAVLPRPQRLAFLFIAPGQGPRDIRIEAHRAGAVRVLHEERRRARPNPAYLDYLLVLKDGAPDRFELVTVVEAPHAQPVQTRYRIELRGRRPPFEARGPIDRFAAPEAPAAPVDSD